MPEVWVLTEEIHDAAGDAYVVHAVCSRADLAAAFVAENGLLDAELDWHRSPDAVGQVRWAEHEDGDLTCRFTIERYRVDAYTPASDGVAEAEAEAAAAASLSARSVTER